MILFFTVVPFAFCIKIFGNLYIIHEGFFFFTYLPILCKTEKNIGRMTKAEIAFLSDLQVNGKVLHISG